MSPADAVPAATRVVVGTSDPVFAALCRRALAGSRLELLAAVSPAELLETTRREAPQLVLLDADGEEAMALKALATKVMLVSDARLVLVSAYLAPGSPGLSALLQSVAATFVQKPEGPSSLSLADGDGPAFVVALQAAFAAHDGHDLARSPAPASLAATPAASVAPAAPSEGAHLPDDFDGGWDLGGLPPAGSK
jgi:hypothetical protein